MLKAIVREAAEYGIGVVLANHQIRDGYPDDWPGDWDGNWFDEDYQPDLILDIWTKLAQQFCGGELWNVLGADLMNEPYALRWSTWARAAEQLGNHLLEQCPRWLMFVQGIGNEEPAEPGMEWGENMIGVGTRPIELINSSKLVYSPHVYGPSLFEANKLPEPEYMSDEDFPRSCRQVWARHFGFVKEKTGRPIVIGEIGGRTSITRDADWQEEFIKWAADSELGVIYFGLNPNAKDSGGVLLDDWTTPHRLKLKLLRRLPSTRLLDLAPSIAPQPPSPQMPSPPLPSPQPFSACDMAGRQNIAPSYCFKLRVQSECDQSYAFLRSQGLTMVCVWERSLIAGQVVSKCAGQVLKPCHLPAPPPPPPAFRLPLPSPFPSPPMPSPPAQLPAPPTPHARLNIKLRLDPTASDTPPLHVLSHHRRRRNQPSRSTLPPPHQPKKLRWFSDPTPSGLLLHSTPLRVR